MAKHEDFIDSLAGKKTAAWYEKQRPYENLSIFNHTVKRELQKGGKHETKSNLESPHN